MNEHLKLKLLIDRCLKNKKERYIKEILCTLSDQLYENPSQKDLKDNIQYHLMKEKIFLKELFCLYSQINLLEDMEKVFSQDLDYMLTVYDDKND